MDAGAAHLRQRHFCVNGGASREAFAATRVKPPFARGDGVARQRRHGGMDGNIDKYERRHLGINVRGVIIIAWRQA
jgi:hypothetical protein